MTADIKVKSVLSKEQKINKIFYILIGFIVFFTTSDLVSGFANKPIFAAICSVISAIIIFIGYFKIVKIKAENGALKISKFIKGNFDKWQIILSVLDVICASITIFTSVMAIGMMFRTIIMFKVLFTPAKVITITNKFKTATKPLIIFCFVWTFIRLKNRIKEKKMNNIKLSTVQKIFICVSFIIGVVYSILSVTCLPQIAFSSNVLVQLGTTLGGTAGMIISAFTKGKEMTDEERAKRDLKIANAEKIAKEKAEVKLKLEQERLENEKILKAKALLEQKRIAANIKAKAEKEESELIALAEKLEAEELIKANEIKISEKVEEV